MEQTPYITSIGRDVQFRMEFIYLFDHTLKRYMDDICIANDIKEERITNLIFSNYFRGLTQFIESVIEIHCDAFELVTDPNDIPYRMSLLMNKLGGKVYTVDEYYFLFNKQDDVIGPYTLSVRQNLFSHHFYNDLGEHILELLGETTETLDYIEGLFTICEKIFTEIVYNFVIEYIMTSDAPLRKLYVTRLRDDVLLIGRA